MKKHTIKSFEDLCNLVNDDNVELLAHDLAEWLIHYNKAMSILYGWMMAKQVI